MVKAGNRCGGCAAYSFHPNEPAYLYLITNKILNQHKIGIGVADTQDSKLKKFLKEGFTLYGIWHHAERKKTFNWEAAIFKEIRVLLKENKNDPELMGNWVRDWSASIEGRAIKLEVLEQIINKVVKS